MIPIEEFKELLGKINNELSEEEILKLRERQDRLAEILFNMWLKTLKLNQEDQEYTP